MTPLFFAASCFQGSFVVIMQESGVSRQLHKRFSCNASAVFWFLFLWNLSTVPQQYHTPIQIKLKLKIKYHNYQIPITKMAITLDGWKGLSMGMFTAVSILGAWVAVVMKRAKQLYVTSGVLFSAGVLLAGGFVHLCNDRWVLECIPVHI